ncbi:MAG TPA: hypothetical protein PKE63_11530 [Lacibacter sp.]|nr:hypothetical protein [Lacibacter sp.]HMO88784.1 hypothetical protein [Lacibacter sp.]HMP87902.1 hypothetical protein [Lacibacter sp.]
MKKSIVPASILSGVMPGIRSIQTAENHLLLLRETGEDLSGKVSLLYHLFFGSTTRGSGQAKEQAAPTEPDYYSSYE